MQYYIGLLNLRTLAVSKTAIAGSVALVSLYEDKAGKKLL
jgi:hypothetical protein